MTWVTSINERWGKQAEDLENKRAKNFAEGMKGRQYCRVQLATGAYVWMWVTDPTKVTQVSGNKLKVGRFSYSDSNFYLQGILDDKFVMKYILDYLSKNENE